MSTRRSSASAGTTRTARTTRTTATTRPARTTATARTTGATRPTWTAPTAAVAIPTGTTTTPVERFTLHGLRPRHEVDQIEELTALLGAYRCRIALDHAHQANLAHTAADDVQGFHHPRQAIALHLKSSANRLGLGTCSQVHRLGRKSFRRCTLGGRRLCLGGVLGGHNLGRLVRGRSYSIDRGGFRRGFHWLCGACVLLRWRRRLGRGFSLGLLRVIGPVSLLGLCRPPQQNSGKLGDGLHGVVPFLAM
jgi:hypothetical protein